MRLLLDAIVTFDGLRLDNDGRIAFLQVLGLGGDGPGDVARTQSQDRSQRRQRRNQHRHNNPPNLFPFHNNLTI